MRFTEPGIQEHHNMRLTQHVLINVLSDMRFKAPFDRFVIVLPNVLEELARNAADRVCIATIGIAKAACNHAPNVRCFVH